MSIESIRLLISKLDQSKLQSEVLKTTEFANVYNFKLEAKMGIIVTFCERIIEL